MVPEQQRPAGLHYGAHVRANGIRQHYVRYGTRGPALVLVPGIISPAALWGFAGRRLAAHFDTYVLDVRGRGLSEAGEHLDYGLDACADDLLAFTEALGLGRCTILGHSMGARIAIRAARRGSDPFDRLVLLDPPMSGPGRRPYPSALDGMIALVRAASRGEAEAMLREPGKPAWPERLLRLRAEWLHTCDERAVVASYRGFHEDDIHADLPKILAPAALIAAERGGVVLPEDAEEVRRLLPGIRFRRVLDAGHQMQVDNPEGTFRAIGEVLDVSL